MIRLIALCLSMAVMLGLFAQPALAQQSPINCVQAGTITVDDLGDRDLASVQLGLRTVLGLKDQSLDDGILGPVTRGALRDLCETYEFLSVEPESVVAETLDLAHEYGELARRVPTWPSALVTIGNLIVPGASQVDLRVLRLAGPPELTAGVLADDTTAVCETLAAGDISSAAQPALDALLRGRDAATLCADLQVVGQTEGAVAILTSLSDVQGVVDAVALLQSPDFLTWVSEDLQARLIQLAGTNTAVIDLLQRFERERPEKITFDPGIPPSCRVEKDLTTLRYFSFGQTELDILTNSVNVGKLLEPLLEAEGVLAQEVLWAEMRPLLEVALDDCALDRIELLLSGPETLGKGYQLDPERVADFKLNQSLIDSEPVLAPLVDLRMPTQEQLLAGVRINLSRALTESLNGQVEVAAELLAGAAEEIQESPDIARVDPENFDTVELPPLLGITDPSAKAAFDTITNEAFREAIRTGPFIIGANDEILKAEVRNLLRPLIGEQVEEAVNRDIDLIRSAIRTDWKVTPEMIRRISALPEVARVAGDATGSNLQDRMKKMIGIEYPNQSLFEAALRDIDPVTPGSPDHPLSKALRDRAVELAQTKIDDPDSTRVTAQLAVEDCGCVPRKVTPDSNEVYGFYPFWYAPLKDQEGVAAEADSAGDSGGADASSAQQPAGQVPELIDYTFVSRTAFYGMEFDFQHANQTADRRNLQLNYLNHWLNMRWDFITSARQHRAKVDVTFDMRNWQKWTEIEQEYAINQIIQHTGPLNRFEEVTRLERKLWTATPTLFDKIQPDGVTLIFEDYTGDPSPDAQINVSTMVRLVNRVQDALVERGQTVNLAFNISFMNVKTGREGLMDDLRELLIKGNDQEKTVDKVLVFLERPTTLTKKLLRQRFDFGEFRGPERETVVSNLIPVLPPGAHEHVTQRPRSNDEAQTKSAPFSQFEDDLIYFAKDFAGVGFWPLPQQSGVETARLKSITLDLWQKPFFPENLKNLEERYNYICTRACPHRASLALLTMALFGTAAGLVAFSYFSGTINKIAFKWYAAYILVFFVILALIILTTCDHVATVPPILLMGLVAFLFVLWAADFVQNLRNGPKP